MHADHPWASQWISVLAASGQLAVALIALSRAGKSLLAIPLALLCADIAAWTGASVAYDLSGVAALTWIDHALSPLSAPLALDFVLVFVGARRASHLVRLAAYAMCGSLAALSSLAFVAGAVRPFVGSDAWGTWLLAGSLPTMAFVLSTLVRHLRTTVDADERARTRILLLVLFVGTLLDATEGVTLVFPAIPGLGSIGMLVCAGGMAVVMFQRDLLGHELTVRGGVLLAGVVAPTLYACAIAQHSRWPTIASALAIVAVLGIIAGPASMREVAQRRERKAEMLVLGRFSSQMAHDLKNPLAALKGAAQLLRRDLDRQEPAVDRVDLADLVLEQAARMAVIIERFSRISRLELSLSRVQLNEIIDEVLTRQAPALGAGLKVVRDLEPLPALMADRDLFATVLENLVRNAVEAMPDGGTLTVASHESGPWPAKSVEVSVEDTGVGMDARTRERATEDFFTTKAQGSGLGLSFAQRIVEAHGGRLVIESDVGRGTRVRFVVPAREDSERAEVAA